MRIICLATLGAMSVACTQDDRLGGQTGTVQPVGCEESQREAVTDLATAAEGFDFSVQDLLDTVEGTWIGSADVDGDDAPDDVEVEVAWDQEDIDAILLEEAPFTGTGPQPGASFDCRPTYELTLQLSVTASPLFDVLGESPLQVRQATNVDVPIEIDAGDLDGELEPPEWSSDQWDRTSLSAVFRGAGADDTSLSLTWWAINDEPAPGTAAAGTASTVTTVEASGKTVPIVTIPLTAQ